jgi:hypothetical protein
MRRKLIGSLVAMTIWLLALTAGGQTSYTVTTSTWSAWDRIERVYVASEHFLVVMERVNYAGGTCDGGRQFYVDDSLPNYDTMTRTLLTAFAADKQIMFRWDGTSIDGGCRGRIDRFQVR